MRWSHLLLLVLAAALSFGGSFTCKGSTGGHDHDDDDDDRPKNERVVED